MTVVWSQTVRRCEKKESWHKDKRKILIIQEVVAETPHAHHSKSNQDLNFWSGISRSNQDNFDHELGPDS